MKTYDPTVVALKADAKRSGRPTMVVMHDSRDARLIIFRIGVGQSLPDHASPSTVLLHVVSGCGLVSGAGGERAVHAGEVVAYEPGGNPWGAGDHRGAGPARYHRPAAVKPRQQPRNHRYWKVGGCHPFPSHRAACSRRIDAELL
jgi:Uncharacterized conserved protein, contains double-stranded beta-helix domain